MSFAALVVLLGGSLMFGLGVVLPLVAGRFGQRQAVPTAERAFTKPPSIGVIIPAYLESSVIGGTIDSLARQLRGWAGKFEIMVVASDEETALAAEKHGARVLRCSPNGKAAAINVGVGESTQDIVVLSDGNCALSPDTWPDILLGALRTADLVSAAKTESGGGETAYWRYESAVKRSGSALQETLSVVGEFMAFRREQFAPVPEGVLSDDLAMAMDFALRGLIVRVCTDIATSEPPSYGHEQLERRIRISAGQWGEALPRWRKLLAIRAGRQFLAHKGYRMSIGAFGFWIAVAGFALLVPPWTLIVTPLGLALAWLVYSRGQSAPAGLRTISTVVMLQVVTLLGLARAIKRSVSRGLRPGWRKVAR